MDAKDFFGQAGPHADEAARLADLRSLNLLDTPREPEFDRLTVLIAEVFSVSTCFISLLEETRQWFKSSVGLDVEETERSIAICAHTINQPSERLVVADTREDPRFRSNRLTTDLHLGCYAGVVLKGPMDLPIGTLCVADHEPRTFSERDVQILEKFAELVRQELLAAAERHQTRAREVLNENFHSTTGLPNRKYVLEVLEAERNSLRTQAPRCPSQIVCLRLKHHSALQQRFREDELAEIMQSVGHRIRTSLRPADLLVQDNDGTFFVHLTRCLRSRVTSVVSRIHRALERSIAVGEERLTIGFRSGSCEVHSEATPEAMLADAELAADSLKGTATELHRFFEPALAEKAQRFQQLDSALRNAIARNELNLVYQPKFSLESERISGAEALLRWSHPTFGSVSPDEFIEVAEASGYIVTLGAWVLDQACAQAGRWIEQGLLAGTIAVNVSPIQLGGQPGFVDRVRGILESTGLPPSRLELELTEKAFAGDIGILSKAMQQLTQLGVRFALDDFGTGYSSLKYLADLPFATLKIDRHFINRAPRDPSVRAIVTAVVAMAKPFRLGIVAEGIEDVEELSLMRQLGVDQGQGYYFSKPISDTALEQRLREATDTPKAETSRVLRYLRSAAG